MNIELGQIVYTQGINSLIKEKIINLNEINNILNKHRMCDFGELCENDKEVQISNIKDNIDDMVMSVYKINNNPIWVITEYNRKYTTVLLPEEY